MNRLFLTIPLILVAACGDDKSPSAPSTTTTAVSVAVSSPVRMGQTTQATGTETLSNGQTRSITAGWLSDAPAVASVTDSGLVTGLANGRATIYVVTNGRQGQQVVRVVPDYQGSWTGLLRVTSGSQTGIFADIHLCDNFGIGTMYSYALGVSQSGEQLTATIDYGASVVFPPVTAPIGADGTSAFTSTVSLTESDITMTVDSAFAINSTRVGELTGTVNELWRLPNITGEGRLAYDIVGMTRSSAATRSGVSSRAGRWTDVLRELAIRRR